MMSVRSNWPVLRFVDAEIGRQLHRAAHAFRHVNEGAVGEHRRIERGEEIVRGRHHRAEILLHQIGMLADRFRHRHEDHAGLLQLVLEGGGNRNRIEHGIDRDAPRAELAAGRLVIELRRLALLAHAGEDLLLLERNAELLIGLENFRIDVGQRLRRNKLLRRRIIIGVLIVDLGIVDARPGRLAHGQPAAIGLEPPGQHPLRLVLLGRDETDGIFGKTLGGLVGFDIGDEPVFILVNVDASDLLDGLLYGRHLLLHYGFKDRGLDCRLWC